MKYLRFVLAFVCTVALLATATAPVLADGNDTLGPPSLKMAKGTGIVSATTVSGPAPGSLEIEIPAKAAARQVLIYWQGVEATDSVRLVNGVEVHGVSVGRSELIAGGDTTFRADITDVLSLHPGLNRVDIALAGLAAGPADAAIIAVVDDGSKASHLLLRDGRDLLSNLNGTEPGDLSIPQTFMLPGAKYDRRLELMLLVGTDGAASSIDIQTMAGSTVSTTTYDISAAASGQGPTFTLVPVTIDIPGTPDVKGAKKIPVPVTVQVAPGNSTSDATDTGSPDLDVAGAPGAGSLGGGSAAPSVTPGVFIGTHLLFSVDANRSGIGDFVWLDGNCDGVQDQDEAGVAEVRVDLFTCDHGFVAFTETDDAGLYEFLTLAPGCYRVQFTLPSGFTFSPPNAAGDDTIDSDANPAN